MKRLFGEEILIPRGMIIGILFSIFSFAYVLSPYWLVNGPSTRANYLLPLTALAGFAWAYFSARPIKLCWDIYTLIHFFVLLAILLVANFRPLTSDVPWRGDEDTHISRVIKVASLIPHLWFWIFVLVFVVFLFLSWKKSRWAYAYYLLWGVIVVLGLLNLDNISIESPRTLVRYPFVNYWMAAGVLWMVPEKFGWYQEILYRIIPFLSAVITASAISRYSIRHSKWLAILVGITVATIPTLFYYSSILYLELPAVLLMAVVCLKIKPLLTGSLNELRNEPAWYALLLIGFIKETSLPFLAIFVLFRIAMAIYRWFNPVDQSSRLRFRQIAKLLLSEASIWLLVLAPIASYLLIRKELDYSRAYTLTIGNLFFASTFQAILNGLVEQFGVFLVIFGLGCILLIRRKEYAQAGFYIAILIGYQLFFAFDEWRYIGYSRFNLFVLPAILAGAVVTIDYLLTKSKLLAGITFAIILAVNLLQAPIQLDGTKIPMWGNYNTDTSEHYYPYQDALVWMNQNNFKGKILFTGQYYKYYYSFYFNKLNWQPEYKAIITDKVNPDAKNLQDAFQIAADQKFKSILFHVVGDTVPPIEEMGGFKHRKIFCNMAHCLVLYY